MNDNKLYELITQIPDGALSMEGLTHIMEKAAGDHVGLMGVSTEELHKSYGAFWMLARCHVSLTTPIIGPGELKCVTCHRDINGVLAYRDFDIYLNGEKVGEAVHAWIITALVDRKMLHPETIPILAEARQDDGKDEKLPKLKAPKNLTVVGQYTVGEGDIDFNGHMNNTRYVGVAEDMVLAGRPYADMRCGYLKECRLGDVLTVSAAEIPGGMYVRVTNAESSPCFDAEFVENHN